MRKGISLRDDERVAGVRLYAGGVFLLRGLLGCLLLVAGWVRAQGPDDPNEGSRLGSGGTPGRFQFSWWGRAGRIYFIQHCGDLGAGAWTYEPVLESGSNQVIAWSFDSASPQLFLRLKYTGTLPLSGCYRPPFGIAFTAGNDANSRVHYTLDGSDPCNESPVIEDSSAPFQIGSRVHFKARFFIDGRPVGSVLTADYLVQGKTLFVKGDSTVAFAESGTTWVWGANRFGQLGVGTAGGQVTPMACMPLAGISGVGVGMDHGFGFWFDGRLKSWGDNSFGQLGAGNRVGSWEPGPVEGLGGGKILGVAAGREFSVALTDLGEVYGWGAGVAGAPGVGAPTGWSLVPAKVGGLPPIQAVAAGVATVYAVDFEGGLWSWGDNSYSQAGVSGPAALPARLAGISGSVTAISAGAAHALALTAGGQVYSFGSNWYGQLGRCDRTTDGIPGLIHFPGTSQPVIVAVAAGDYHNLALASDGSVYAWGAGWSGQNGDAGCADLLEPRQVSGLSKILELGAGRAHSVALGSDGAVYTWGENGRGQLGRTISGESSSDPVRVPGLQLLDSSP